MSKAAVVSAAIALPAVAVIAVWVVNFSVPSLMTTDDDHLMRMYQIVLGTGVLTLPVAVLWRWYAGANRFTTGVLILALVAAGINCCGFVTAIFTALGQL